jgi:hypothetical protein
MRGQRCRSFVIEVDLVLEKVGDPFHNLFRRTFNDLLTCNLQTAVWTRNKGKDRSVKNTTFIVVLLTLVTCFVFFWLWLHVSDWTNPSSDPYTRVNSSYNVITCRTVWNFYCPFFLLDPTSRFSLKYRVIKKPLCTWWLQYRNLQVMFKVLPASLQTFIDCLADDRQGQEDTRLTLTPPVIPNSNYVTMVSDWNFLKYFCVFFVL